MSNKKSQSGMSRRDFIKTTSAVTLAAAMPRSGGLFAAGSDKIRVGMIGCGGRGTGAAVNCIEARPDAVITAMGDLFEDHLENSFKRLTEKVPKKNLAVTKERLFTGFDAYKKVLSTDVDLVIMASPPHFRPIHLKAAVEAGKHVFMEKPVAVDPPGVRSIIASSELAEKKGLAIVAGTQRRHQAHYLE
ncbi:MAG: Gfo/Idh/MocA family oxidoreductase, partial [Candidatus Aminicenantes bacterium]|nr:Gfo/Idh/MocA family oxidoreductase [Candidatus Aminicenantes bacterium]